MEQMKHRKRPLIGSAAATLALFATLFGAAPPTGAASADDAAAPQSQADQCRATHILSAPTCVAHTAAGDVGYREVGSGSSLLLVMGAGGSMDEWAPDLVDALAARHTVVVFDNAGIGQTSALPGTLTISAMADQTSALISTLQLHHPAVLGWSLGGMVAQALAVQHPGQTGPLVLAASQAGTGAALPIPPAAAAAAASSNPAAVLSVLFPADQRAAAVAYTEQLSQYAGFYGAPTAVHQAQDAALAQWMAGRDPSGTRVHRIHVPVLVADGDQDALDPAQNATILAGSLRHAQVRLYPDAGHAFLFQNAAAFVTEVDDFLG